MYADQISTGRKRSIHDRLDADLAPDRGGADAAGRARNALSKRKSSQQGFAGQKGSEVDMAALRHMTESDLKALGIPMADAQATRVLLANAGCLPGGGAVPAVLSQCGDPTLLRLVLAYPWGGVNR
uniref:SAM domain-containing protein n=1 Tax=Aegilops tauschii TaxID=37682 RepID=M8BX53_AEGTA